MLICRMRDVLRYPPRSRSSSGTILRCDTLCNRPPRCVPTALPAQQLVDSLKGQLDPAALPSAAVQPPDGRATPISTAMPRPNYSTVCGTGNQTHSSVVPLIAETIAELPMHLKRTPAPQHLSDFHGLLEPQSRICPVRAVLCRISAVAASGAEPVPTRATKAYNIARENLAAAVLYDAAEPGLKQSREAGTRRTETSEGCRKTSRTASFGATE